MASLEQARGWKLYPSIVKKSAWRAHSRHARRQLLADFVVVCVIDDVIEKIIWTEIACAADKSVSE